MKYTKEEKKKIKKAYELVISDLNAIWQQCEEETLKFIVDGIWKVSESINTKHHMRLIYDWYLVLTKRNAYVVNETGDTVFDIITLATSDIRGQLKPSCKEIELVAGFIEAYPKIRERAIRKIEENIIKKANKKESDIKRKKEQLENIRKVTQTYEKEASIEIDLPKTQNQHQLVVTEEDGRTIGTLDFGGRTIKVITDGDIVLVRKINKEQPKIKQK